MKKERAAKTRGAFTDFDEVWPADTWSCSTPEAQGVDSTRLLDMLKAVKSNNIGIDGLLVIRNGRLIMEMYRYPYKADTLHHIYSCTKSFTSSLIGIALEQGRIKGPSQCIEDFFYDRQIANPHKAKRTITLGNLLTMSSGYEWIGGMLEQPTLQEWWQSAD
jgi:CubicO group peptidase (beta-lactamase class C family)